MSKRQPMWQHLIDMLLNAKIRQKLVCFMRRIELFPSFDWRHLETFCVIYEPPCMISATWITRDKAIFCLCNRKEGYWMELVVACLIKLVFPLQYPRTGYFFR